MTLTLIAKPVAVGKTSFYRPECTAGFVVDFGSLPSSSRFTTSELDLFFLGTGGTANTFLELALQKPSP